MRLFCDRRCAGLARRKNKTPEQKKREKAIYDADYRARNLARIKAAKKAHFKRTYDPAKARVERKKRAAAHAEYCRRPEYRKWKSGYDRQRRASEFGAFDEAYLLAIDLNREIKERMTNEQIKRENGTWAKRQERSRSCGEKGVRHRDRTAYGKELA